MKQIIEHLAQRVAKYPNLRFEKGETSITVFPESENGFEVSFHVGQPGLPEPYTVYFNGWHESFADETEALECFVMGLTCECRLKETTRGDHAFSWTLEYLNDGVWEAYSSTTLILEPFWRKKNERYLQNKLRLRA